MTLENVLHALPSRHDLATLLAQSVGVQPRPSRANEISTAIGLFGTGLLLGAGLSLLFAPKPGRDLRHDIASKVGELGGRRPSEETGDYSGIASAH